MAYQKSISNLLATWCDLRLKFEQIKDLFLDLGWFGERKEGIRVSNIWPDGYPAERSEFFQQRFEAMETRKKGRAKNTV